MVNPSFPSGNSIISRDGRATEQFRAFLQQLASGVLKAVQTGWAAPVGSGSRASINANYSTAIGNPPTQAQVQAMEAQLEALSKAVAQLIKDLESAGAISP